MAAAAHKLDSVPRFSGVPGADTGALSRLWESLERYRCFVLADAVEEGGAWGTLVAAAREIHHSDASERYQMWRGLHGTWRGYQPSQVMAASLASQVDVCDGFVVGARGRRYSSFDVGPPWGVRRAAPCGGILDAKQPWPARDGFERAIEGAFAELQGFGEMVARGLLSGLTVAGGDVMPSIDAPCSSVRLLSYEPGEGFSETHTDYELLTFIVADRPGLQVMGADGAWREPHVGQGDVLVLGGDALEALTCGALRAALHRVRADTATRLSCVLFVGVNYDVELPMPSVGRRIAFGQLMEGSIIRNTPHLWARYRAGALDVPFEIPEPSPFKGEPV